jgi:hypothetical protein
MALNLEKMPRIFLCGLLSTHWQTQVGRKMMECLVLLYGSNPVSQVLRAMAFKRTTRGRSNFGELMTVKKDLVISSRRRSDIGHASQGRSGHQSPSKRRCLLLLSLLFLRQRHWTCRPLLGRDVPHIFISHLQLDLL